MNEIAIAVICWVLAVAGVVGIGGLLVLAGLLEP